MAYHIKGVVFIESEDGSLTTMHVQGPADAAQQLRASGAAGVRGGQPGGRQQGGAAAAARLRHSPAPRAPQQRRLLLMRAL